MKSLSRTDKEVLLKTVAQVLPISIMSVFLLPLGVCRVIEVLFNRFWWGCNLNGGKGIKWMQWNRLCKPNKYTERGISLIPLFSVSLWSLIQAIHGKAFMLLKI